VRSRQGIRGISLERPDGVLVVLDEAYIDYAVSMGLRDAVEAYRKRKNLLILRTFSKVYGLADCASVCHRAAGAASAMNK